MTARPDPWVTVHTLDGFYVNLGRVQAASVMDLVEHYDREALHSFDLDDGRSQVHVPGSSIARIDVDWELSRLQQLRRRLRVFLDRWS